MKNLNTNLLLIAAIIVIIIGLKLTSLESGAAHIQNDGYSVTGGVISSFGGTLLGLWLYGKRSK